jgi:hypothetical protein
MAESTSPQTYARAKTKLTLGVVLIALLSLVLAVITLATGIELLVDPHGWILRTSMNWLDRLGFIPHAAGGALPGTSILFWAMMTYTVIFLLEGGGMLLRRAWAEYLVLLELALILPPEIVENWQHTDWLRLLTLVFNLFIFVYLGYRRWQSFWLRRRALS